MVDLLTPKYIYSNVTVTGRKRREEREGKRREKEGKGGEERKGEGRGS